MPPPWRESFGVIALDAANLASTPVLPERLPLTRLYYTTADLRDDVREGGPPSERKPLLRTLSDACDQLGEAVEIMDELDRLGAMPPIKISQYRRH